MSTIITQENAGIEGFLSIDLIPEGSDKRIPYLREGRNRITNVAREHLLHLAVDSPVVLTPNPIIEYRIGGGGAGQIYTGAETIMNFQVGGPYPDEDTATGGYLPTAVVPYDVYDPTAITKSYVIGNNRIVDIQFSLSTTDANGLSISEVGLFCQNGWMGNLGLYGRMFNIKNFPAITKSGAFSVAFTWRINFSGTCS